MNILNPFQQFLLRVYEFISTNRYFKYLSFLVMALITYRWFHFIDIYSVNILFWDQWDFCGAFLFGQDPSIIDIYTWQHGPHRQGLGFILHTGLDKISSWNTRYISFAIGVLLLITAVLYAIIKRNRFGSISFFDVLIFALVLTPLQYEIFSSTPNLSHGAMPAMLIAAFCLCLPVKNIFLRHCLLLIINFNLIFTGFGIFIGLLTPLILLSEGYYFYKSKEIKNTWISLTSFALSLFALYLFSVDYRFDPANADFQFPHSKPWEYLYFLAAGFANFVGIKGTGLWVYVSGSILVISLIYILIKHLVLLFQNTFDLKKEETGMSKIIVVLISFSLLFYLNTAVGRVSFGLEIAQSSRYVPYLVPAMIGLYFHLNTLNKSFKAFLIPLLFLILSFSYFSIKNEIHGMKYFTDGKKAWKANYLKYEDIQKADSLSNFKIYPDPEASQLERKLQYLKENKLNLYLDQK